MSYTYPEAIVALEAIGNDFIKIMRPNTYAPVHINCDVNAQTASVSWDAYGITINLPVRTATSRMTQDEFLDWVAYMLHELGHPTHTDQAVWYKAVAMGLSRMVNGLEDVRMEQAVISSGIVHNAKAVLSRLLSRKIVEARNGKQPWNPNSRREIAWTLCVLGRANNGYAFDASDMAWIKASIKPGSTVALVLNWALPALAQCQNTADCLALAERIHKAIAAPQGNVDTRKPLPNPPPQKTSPDAPEGDGEGDEGEGDEGEVD